LDTSTTPDTLKIRNASDNGWISLGTAETGFGLADLAGATFTGNVLVPAGTEGAPGLGIAGNTNTGIYKVGTNDLGITAGGTRRVHIHSDGLTIRDGKGLRLQDSGNSNIVELKAPALTSDVVLTLPPSDGDSGDMLQTNGSGVLTWEPVQGVPTGTVFCVAYATIPSGYLECNGAAVSRSTYATLFSKLSTLWGSGDGSGTFNLPDLRGEFVRGLDQGRMVDAPGGNTRSPWSSQASQYAQHNHSASATSSAGSHSHSLNYQQGQVEDTGTSWITDIRRAGGDGDGGKTTYTNDTSSGFMNSASISVSTSVTVNNNGGTDNSSETRPRNISMIYIIKT